MKENDKEPEQNNDINLRNDLNKCKQIKNMVKENTNMLMKMTKKMTNDQNMNKIDEII
jgi:hypothetical protein